MEYELIIIASLFFVVAVLYSSAGFGGGSSYLAILSLFSIDFLDVKLIALLCNVAVVSGSVLIFNQSNFIDWKKVIPLVLLSVPMAYIGGSFQLEEKFFFLLLASSLFVAAMLMLFWAQERKTKQLSNYANGIVGGGIGFLSGLVGIGGGIFLSPILYLSNWAKPKVIAATTAFFILVNSLAGVLGLVSSNFNNIDLNKYWILIIVVILGGQIGSRVTIKKLNPTMVKKTTGALILIVSLRLFYQYLF